MRIKVNTLKKGKEGEVTYRGREARKDRYTTRSNNDSRLGPTMSLRILASRTFPAPNLRQLNV